MRWVGFADGRGCAWDALLDEEGGEVRGRDVVPGCFVGVVGVGCFGCAFCFFWWGDVWVRVGLVALFEDEVQALGREWAESGPRDACSTRYP